MDIVERLTLEAAQADTMLAEEHRHRYRFAARLCADRRVLDLCCGSGYGSAILAGAAREVVGVDNDAATVELARSTIGAQLSNVSFELAEAVAFLGDAGAAFETVVCFEGLEHLGELDRALTLLRECAERGSQIIASVPNGKLFGERNPFHVTNFGYDEALAAFAPFPATMMVPQFLAEGSLICPPGANGIEVQVTLEERDEPEYANHFLFCVNCDPEVVLGAQHGHIQVSAAPVFNRWSEGLKHAMWALRRENARLARARLGKGGSAAAAALVELDAHQSQLAELQARLQASEARVVELEAAAAITAAPARPPLGEPPGKVLEIPGSSPALEPGEDPNTWEHRRRRATDFLIPWIEQTVPLQGTTVLEYGCGNAAVSCAFATPAARVIGVDIDPAGIELGQAKLREHAIENVELELHPLESVAEAVAARTGEIDVFLLYAVLEHLTVRERLDLLTLARRVVKADGAIVVCEAPNRLIYFDHHTAQMPFFHLLPPELALEYRSRSPRSDFTAAIDAAVRQGQDAALHALVRWGRGVSFHEFEVVFGDLSRHVIASNYDPLLFGERPVQPDEVILARYLDRWRPDLAPVWSRYWLDLILSPTPVDKRPLFLRPWTAETIGAAGAGLTRSETLAMAGPEATLAIELPAPTRRLVIGCVKAQSDPLALLVWPRAAGSALSTVIEEPPGEVVYRSFELSAPEARLTLEAGAACELIFIGYEA